MARGAVGQTSVRGNVIVDDEVAAGFQQVGGVVLGGVVGVGDEHVGAGPHEMGRIAMAREAPFHLEAGVLEHEWHFGDLSVAGGAADAFVDVDAVIEVDEIREVVDTCPFHGGLGAPAFADRLKHGCVGPDFRVAGHAGLGGWNAGEAGIFHGRMAIATIKTKAFDMVFMTERDGLIDGDASVGEPGRALDRCANPTERAQEENAAEDARLGERVHAGMKYLGHGASGVSVGPFSGDYLYRVARV